MQNELSIEHEDKLGSAVERIQRRIAVSQELVANLPDDVRPAAFAQVLKWVGEADFAEASPKRKRRSTSSRIYKPAPSGNETRLDRPKNPQRSGPKDWTIDLIENGFFGLPRTASDTVKELREKYGRTVPLKDMTKVLLRLLQGGRLSRTGSAEKGYDYSKVQ